MCDGVLRCAPWPYEAWWRRAIHSTTKCSPLPNPLADLEQFAEGDLTYVGERGITLSGGQKRRLALARALYANSDVFLIDDILGEITALITETDAISLATI